MPGIFKLVTPETVLCFTFLKELPTVILHRFKGGYKITVYHIIPPTIPTPEVTYCSRVVVWMVVKTNPNSARARYDNRPDT